MTSRKAETQGSGKALRHRQTLIAWGFSLPFIIIFSMFMLLPLLSALYMSFTDITAHDLRTPFNVNFVGLQQYIALFKDPLFRHSLLVTGTFVIIGVPVTIIIALALAVALNKGMRHLNSFFRALFYAPVVASVVAVSVVWRYILQDDGLLNNVLKTIGIHGPAWLNDTHVALLALIIMTVWRNVGTSMIIFIAGLQGMSGQVEEAASIDGCNAWQRFIHITLPLLKPTLLLSLILVSVSYLQFFDESFVMTQGGPLNATLSASYYIYKKFGFGQYGMSSAASWVLFIIIALVSVLQFRVMRSDD
ncbi:multiple sugar transport system permease protein [Bifidobacterium bohemicum]|uniref:ABC transporter, permease protein n=2 Tax=Bifidobacterium bohemicum TaxID=638617 RepID=A0A086ZGS3_9BIFI|nr:sugar ABC transporter permease [Bifidobacterium bohemicum]KFI45723.1 ABC transporter, permease protein [Bifidobacterium bohemicum DSM 22767]SCC07963.1 multiple sugar transport system permease protein [Bifidobacterium bohemicum]